MSKMPVDMNLIRELADLLADTDLSEIEVADGDRMIRVARTRNVVSAPVTMPAPVADAAPVAAAPAEAAASPAIPADAVTSPMVGTAYLSPEPGAANFVQAGDRVTKGQTLLIVEAMKVMNPIAAPKDGKVSAVLVGNEEPVEFGQALVVLE